MCNELIGVSILVSAGILDGNTCFQKIKIFFEIYFLSVLAFWGLQLLIFQATYLETNLN